MDSDSIRVLIFLGFLLLVSSFFAATEMAFTSLNRVRLKHLADNGNKNAELAFRLLRDYDKLLSTLLVANNVVNIAMASITTVLFIKWFGDNGNSATFSTLVVTVVVLLFGEFTPKSLAKKSPERFALFAAPLVKGVVVLLAPINFLFYLWQKLISKIFRGTDEPSITEEELLTLVDEAQLEGAINEADSELIHSVIDFNDRLAGEILTPRVNVVGISVEDTMQDISKTFAESGYSRVPVFEGSLDNIVGVLHMKDFFNHLLQDKQEIDSIINPVVYITPSMKISDLFTMFQKTKSHFAIAADEYGGTLGIVTLEDVLEELVGEIWDEHDEITEEFVALGDGGYQVMCGAEIDNLFELFEMAEESEGEAATVSGWIMEQLGKIPEPGEAFTYKDLAVTITKTDQRRVLECLVTRVEPQEDNEEDE